MKRCMTFLIPLCFLAAIVIGFSPERAHAKTILWNLSLWGEERAWTKPVHEWANAMLKQTNGQWRIKIHYGSVLAHAAKNWNGIRDGKFEAAGICMAYSPGKTPLHTVQELPFIAPEDTEDIARMWIALWKHPAMRKELLKWNAVPLLPAADTQNQLMGTKQVKSVSDLSGTRIRVSGEIAKVLNKFGATTTMLHPKSAYTALGSGTIDLAALPWAYAFGSYKVYEVSKYATDKISLGTTGCVYIANKNAWNALPEAFKKYHQEWFRDAPKAWKDAFSESNQKWIRIFKSKLEIVEFPERERNKLVARAQEVYDAWVAGREKEGLPGREILEYYLQTRENLTGR